MKKAILATKVGMTQIFNEDGVLTPVTVLQAGPCVVTQIKTVENDGYSAVQVGFGDKRESLVNKPMKGQFSKAGVSCKRFVREFKFENAEDYKVADEIKADIFAAGDLVDAIGVSRGKGFAGTIERHNFARGPMKHGSKSHREPGSNGPMHSGPGGRVIKGKKLPGRLGGQSATVQRLTIAKVDAERNLIMVKGSVPGAAGTFLMLRDTVRPVVKKADKK